jgi:signal transduction histidine kinase
MSHELRTPLNSIIGFTNRVLKKSGDNLPQMQQENLHIVLEEAQHLLELINSLLDYSKIEAGKMELHIENFNLLKVMDEVYSMTKTLSDSKNLCYKQESYTNEAIPITSDRIKVKQIFINLVSNAFKYSEKGTITFSIENVNDYYCIKVSDEGVGISRENLDYIFEEFRQVDGSYTRKVGGTGLGLSITKKFVELLGGKIQVTSELGIGSCFTVYLPVNIEEKREDFIIDGNFSNEYKKKVLCVDDDINVQKLYKQYLNEYDIDVISLNGQESIIEKVIEIVPDVILLDIMLPNKDG